MFDIQLIDELLQPWADAEFDRERNIPYVRRELGAQSVILAKNGRKN
jgi:hypothetical protein